MKKYEEITQALTDEELMELTGGYSASHRSPSLVMVALYAVGAWVVNAQPVGAVASIIAASKA